MPPFLPIVAADRSQNVRIANQKVLTNKVTYVDFGQIAIPGTLGTNITVGKETELGKEIEITASATGTKSPGLKKEKYFGYAINALDAFGGETPIGVINIIKSGAGAEGGSGEWNQNELKWNAVPFASGYKVFRNGVSKTGLSEAEAKEKTPEFIAEVIKPEYIDYGAVEPKGKPPTKNNTFYNTNKVAQKPFRELQNHLAMGAIIPVGALTPNPADWVPYAAKTWELKLESEKFKLEKGEIRQRSTGIIRTIAEAKPTITKAASKEEYIYLIVYNTITGIVEALKGKKVEEGKASLTEATIEEAKTEYMQPLFGLKQTGTGTTPTIINEVLPGGIIVGLLNLARV